MEIWKPISGWEDRYEVSSEGNIRNVKTWGKGWKQRYLKKRDLSNCISNKGDVRVRLGNRNGYDEDRPPETIKVHREVAKAFIENTNNHTDVLHINRDKTDNRVANLKWVDRLSTSGFSGYTFTRK